MKRSNKKRVIAALLLGLSPAFALAQEPEPKPSRGTLPPVEVRPPDRGDASDVMPSEFDPSELTRYSYPSWIDQVLGGSPGDFGGLNSANRVESSLFAQPNNSTIVDSNSIREKMAPDMFHALQYEVGVLMQSTGRGQASPFIRGVTGQQVLVLVDGVRMNNQVLRAGPNQYFNTVDPGQVERIEVIRGGGSVAWGGDAIGGVINIVTRGADPYAGDYRGGSFRSFYGTADSGWYGRANVEGWVGATGIFAGGSYYNTHDLDIGGDHGRQPFTSYDQYAGDVKLNRMIGDEQMITLAFSHFEQGDLARSDRFAPFVFNRPGNTPRPTFFDPQQRDMAYLRWQGYAANNNALFDVFSMTGSYVRTSEGTSELRSATRLDEGHFYDDVFGYTLTLNKDAGVFGRWTYGADFYHDDIDAKKRSINPSNPAAPPTTRTPQYPDDASADRVGTFASVDVPLTCELTATVGTRYENVDLRATPTYQIGSTSQNIHFARTYQEWVSSIGLNYAVNDKLALVGGVYEGFRSPTIDDLTASATFLQNAQQDPVFASLSVQPEHSYTYEIGAKYDGQWLRLQVYEWWMTIDDYISRAVDNVGNTYLGNGQAYLNGTEFVGEYLMTEEWSLYGNFAYTYGQDQQLNAPFSRIPPTQGILGVRWRDTDRRNYVELFTWMVNRQDRYSATNLTDSRFWVNGQPATPGYATLNLRCGTTLGECDSHRLSLMLENITNQYYRVLGSGVDGAGFNAIFGYEFVR